MPTLRINSLAFDSTHPSICTLIFSFATFTAESYATLSLPKALTTVRPLDTRLFVSVASLMISSVVPMLLRMDKLNSPFSYSVESSQPLSVILSTFTPSLRTRKEMLSCPLTAATLMPSMLVDTKSSGPRNSAKS